MVSLMPTLIAGTGFGILPEFLLREELGCIVLERLRREWSLRLDAVYWVMPPEGPPPKRVKVLGAFLIEKLARRGNRERPRGSRRSPRNRYRRWARIPPPARPLP